MPARAMIWSLPVELSLTSTMVCLAAPAALIEISVSLRVWLLAVTFPVDSACRLAE